MSAPNYGHSGQYSTYQDGQPLFQSPEMTAYSFQGLNPHQTHGIEMQQTSRPDVSQRQISFASDSSMPAAKPIMTETTQENRPFLPQGPYKSSSMSSNATTGSVKAKTGKQLRGLIVKMSGRWLITFVLCFIWALSVFFMHRKGQVTENTKRLFNAGTTGVALCLGLNFASSFKEMALNMRWPILANRERNLVELDLILRADSLTELSRLVFTTRRIGVIAACVLWLIVNIAAQVGVAVVSLTYGFETDDNSEKVLLNYGNVSTAQMDRFYPLDTNQDMNNPNFDDEAYMSHFYGSTALLYYFNTTDNFQSLPKAGTRIRTQDSYIFYYNNGTNNGSLIFPDFGIGGGVNTISVYTERVINASYSCEAHQVTLATGNGTTGNIVVGDGIGDIFVSLASENSTTFFNRPDYVCATDQQRCAIIEAFEASYTNPWYYRCNITLGETQNDPLNISYVSDSTALVAATAITDGGIITSINASDPSILQAAQIFPQSSFFGMVQNGNTDSMGINLGFYALAALQGAALYNPRQYYNGSAPSQGQQLTIGHVHTFLGILVLIFMVQLVFIIIVANWSNRVKVGEDSPVEMSVLMRPIADKLDDIKEGKGKKAFKKAKKQVFIQYRRDEITGKWAFGMRQ